MDNIFKAIYLEGINAYKKKDYKTSSAIFLRLSKNFENSSVIHFFSGASFYMLKKYSMSIPFFQKVIHLKKNYQHTMKSCVFLGHIYVHKKMYDKASDVLQIAIKEKYKNPSPYALMGYIAHENQKYEEADLYYKKCLSFSEKNPSFNNNYGYNLLVWQKKPDQAISYFQKALEHKPKNPTYLHSLGWALYQKKRYADAAKILQRALTLKQDELIKKHLSMARKKIRKVKKI